MWIRLRGAGQLAEWESYRDVRRTGRGSALSPAKRKKLWAAFSNVQARLDDEGQFTWGSLCDEANRLIVASGTHPFRHVVVDEAQDLGPRELRFVARLALPGPRSLFFAGDVGQRIYRYPFSWIQAGIDVRGRASRLSVNYRTSAQIKDFSDRLLPERMEAVDGEEEARATVSLFSGPEPEIVGAESVDGEIQAVSEWLSGLREQGFECHEIAIFTRTRRLLDERATTAVSRACLDAQRLSADGEIEKGRVSLGTMHIAKGLEFRAVALVGCEADTVPLKASIVAEDDPEARRIAEDRERHLFYVGCSSRENGVDANLELIFGPSVDFWGGSLRPALGASINTEADTSKVYVDARFEVDTDIGLFFALGVGGAVHDGELNNNDKTRKALGSRVLFHFPIEIGYRFDEHHGVSVFFDHMSNAWLADYNPGMDTLGMRYGYRF